MKTNFLLILVMSLSNLLSAQTNHAYDFLKYHENSDYVKKMKAVIETPFNNNNNRDITVNDSIYTYVGKTTNTNWNLSYREKTLNFNENGKMTNAIRHFYNENNGTWGNKKDTVSVEYFNSGIKKEYLTKPWDSDQQQWADTNLYYKYNEEGTLTEFIYRSWGYDSHYFFYGFKEAYTLNDDGTIASYLYYYWWNPTGDWVLEHKTTYFYNNGLLEKMINEELDNNQQWVNFAQIIYTYDENDIRTERLYQEWSDFDQDWRNFEKILYTYDNNNLSGDKTYFWDVDNDNWNITLQASYTYNDNNDLIEKFSEYFSNQQWENDEIYTYTYDDNNNLLVYMKKEWNTDNLVWDKVIKKEYFWSQNSDISNIDNNNIKVFPNPVNDILYFENCKDAVISIYDIKGSLINKKYMRNNSINVSNLNKGCYFIKIIKDNNIATSKFIKK